MVPTKPVLFSPISGHNSKIPIVHFSLFARRRWLTVRRRRSCVITWSRRHGDATTSSPANSATRSSTSWLTNTVPGEARRGSKTPFFSSAPEFNPYAPGGYFGQYKIMQETFASLYWDESRLSIGRVKNYKWSFKIYCLAKLIQQ